MSAIYGFVLIDGGSPPPSLLASMEASLDHRGPDGRSLCLKGSLGMGLNFLRTVVDTDPEVAFDDGSAIIVSDSRLDNREELIGLLGLPLTSARQMPDGQLILACYQKWGEECPVRLLGDFAFAIWDEGKRKLFCSRDALGVKPLQFVYLPGRIFAFSTEIKALLRIPGIEYEVEVRRIGDYLSSLPADKQLTFFKGVSRLPPGHSVTMSEGRIRLKQYWTPAPCPAQILHDAGDFEASYRATFTRSVGARLRHSGSLGAALSGGLDSSSIVCVARELLRGSGSLPLHTFSAVFDDVRESDEREYMDAVIGQGGLVPHRVRADLLSPLAEWEKVLWHQEEPIWTPNLFMHWGLYGAAKERGVRVFLDGFLGDNIVGHGWEHLIDLAFDWRLISLFRQIDGVTRKQEGFSFPSMAWTYIVKFSLLARMSLTLRSATKQGPRHPQGLRLDPLINQSFAEHIDLAERVREFRQPPTSPPDAWKKRHLGDVNAGEIPLALEVSNKVATAFGIEARYPFADRRMVELCLAIPPDRLVQGGLSRMIVRRALEDLLPPAVCWRSGKGNLSFNIARRLLDFERERLDDIILGPQNVLGNYCDTTRLRNRYSLYLKDPNRFRVQEIWAPVNLALWLDVFQRRLLNRPFGA